ncbi:hypothetical protein HMPREF1326_02522 [Akkermansia sp. KLE1605]|jgi:hypothetical protein|nr:hypothetical protein HMPREF1326_02522 [Akkermansia sp. KLE1605]
MPAFAEMALAILLFFSISVGPDNDHHSMDFSLVDDSSCIICLEISRNIKNTSSLRPG